jgi:SAM-dependent methyltransferase
MSLRQDPCDLCEQRDFDTVSQADRRGNPLVTVVCRACGLISHEKVPSDQELADYYRENYRSDYHGEYTPSPYRVVREWNRGRELLHLLNPFLRDGETVFEIGSGIGCTVKNFECAGYDALGVEPGDGFRSFAADRLAATVLPGVLNDLPGEPLGDMALLVHVLEHLNSPTRALQHIRRLLRPGGRLYIEVPNAAAPHAAPGKMFHYAHIYNFTPQTLQMLAHKAGFHVRNWLSPKLDRNLRALLHPVASTEWQMDPTSYDATMESLARYGTIGYHLRWAYFAVRLQTLLSHASDRIGAASRMRRIIEQCRQHTRSDSKLRRAA